MDRRLPPLGAWHVTAIPPVPDTTIATWRMTGPIHGRWGGLVGIVEGRRSAKITDAGPARLQGSGWRRNRHDHPTGACPPITPHRPVTVTTRRTDRPLPTPCLVADPSGRSSRCSRHDSHWPIEEAAAGRDGSAAGPRRSRLPGAARACLRSGSLVGLSVARGDLSQAQWQVLEEVLPPVKPTGRRPRDRRQVINGIRWRIRTGAPWRDIPARYGPWETCTACSAPGSATAPGRRSSPTCRPAPTPRG